MKVLYIGYYRENSDWGRQTVNNIRALEKAGVDVVCRAIELGSGTGTPDEIKHLEDKESVDITHCIQHCFPEHMVGSDKFKKNIGLFTNDFVDIRFSSWVSKLKLMDEIWVPSQTCWIDSLHEELRQIAKYVPLAIDTSVFNKQYNSLAIPEIDGDFKFYTVSTGGSLTGLEWIIPAFHAEFDPIEPVSLIIQVETRGNGEAESKAVEDLSRRIKTMLRTQSGPEWYKKDVIISSPNVTYQNLLDLHSYADCYVTCNTGVSFPLSEINAAGFGNTPIVSSDSSVSEYIGGEGNVNSVYQVVQSESSPWSDANNGKDFWIRPCERDIRRQMRQLYEEYQSNPMKHKIDYKQKALAKLNDYSLENAGLAMKEALGV